MPIGILAEMQGMTAEMYDALNDAMGFPEQVPDGLLMHLAGPIDGGFRVVDVWESREKFDRFAEGTLMPAFGQLEGRDRVQPNPPQQFDVHNTFKA